MFNRLKKLTIDTLSGWLVNRGSDAFWDTGERQPIDAKTRRFLTDTEAVEMYRAVAYACANINAQVFASVGMRLYSRKKKSVTDTFTTKALTRRDYTRLQNTPSLSRKMANFGGSSGDDFVELTDHPLLDLMSRVNDELNRFSLFEFTCLYQEVCGTSYWYFEDAEVDVGDGVNRIPTDILLIPTQLVRIQRNVEGVTYSLTPSLKPLDTTKLVAFRYPSLRDPYFTGDSPLIKAFGSIILTEKDTALANEILDHEGQPDVIVSSKNGTLNRDNARRLEKSINARFMRRGGDRFAFIPDDVTLTPLAFNSKQLELLARRGVSKVEIANAFGVPIALLEAKEINRATLEGATYQHRAYTILPKCTRFYEQLNAKVASRFGDDLFFWFDNPVPDDEQAMAIVQGTKLDKGSVTINEVRSENGMEPVAWGEQPWLNSSLTQIGGAERELAATDNTELQSTQDTQQPNEDLTNPAGQTLVTSPTSVLQGSQIAAASTIVLQVSQGIIPVSSGLGLLQVMFNLSTEQAKVVLGTAGTEKVQSNQPVTNPPSNESDKKPPKEKPKNDTLPKSVAKHIELLTDCAVGKLDSFEATKRFVSEGIDYKLAWETVHCRRGEHISGFSDPLPAVEKSNNGRSRMVGADSIDAEMRSIFAKQRSHTLDVLSAAAKQAAHFSDLWEALEGINYDTEYTPSMVKSLSPEILVGIRAGVVDSHKAVDDEIASRMGKSNGNAKSINARVKTRRRKLDVDADVIKRAADQLTLHFCRATNNTTSLRIKDAVAKLRTDIANAVIEGKDSPRALTRLVQRIFDEAETDRAKRIAVTEASRAVNYGQKLAARESGIVTGLKWILSDAPCPICEELADKVVGVNEIFGKSQSSDPDYEDIECPPAHPNCKCSMEEVLAEDLFEDLQRYLEESNTNG